MYTHMFLCVGSALAAGVGFAFRSLVEASPKPSEVAGLAPLTPPYPHPESSPREPQTPKVAIESCAGSAVWPGSGCTHLRFGKTGNWEEIGKTKGRQREDIGKT